jgi:hypothetical protein
MSKEDEAKHHARHTLEFKLEAVRLVNASRIAATIFSSSGSYRP